MLHLRRRVLRCKAWVGGYVEEVGGAPCGVQGAGCSQDLGCPLDQNRDRFDEHRLALEVLEMVLVDDQTVSMMTLKKKREEVSSFWKKDKRWTNSAEVLCGVGVVHGPSAEVLCRVGVCGAQGQCRGAAQGGCVCGAQGLCGNAVQSPSRVKVALELQIGTEDEAAVW